MPCDESGTKSLPSSGKSLKSVMTEELVREKFEKWWISSPWSKSRNWRSFRDVAIAGWQAASEITSSEIERLTKLAGDYEETAVALRRDWLEERTRGRKGQERAAQKEIAQVLPGVTPPPKGEDICDRPASIREKLGGRERAARRIAEWSGRPEREALILHILNEEMP
jgi:hypothetical protein